MQEFSLSFIQVDLNITFSRRRIKNFLMIFVCGAAIALAMPAQGFDKKKYSQSLNEFRPMAEQGDIEAQFIIGLIYLESPITGDIESAEYWLEKAAENGHLTAQVMLGDIYRSNRKMRDYAKAIRWFEVAANRGDAVAQYGLGTMFYHGYGVEKNNVLAMNWFLKSAEQNEVRAQGILGNMYLQGQGAPQNYRLSAKWFRLAANQGDALAMYALGLIYENGLGFERNLMSSHFFYSLANTAGHKSDLAAMLRVGAKLSPSEINEAQRLAKEWKPGTPLPNPSSRPSNRKLP